MITIAILLLKSRDNYMRKHGSFSPLSRKIRVKRMQIQFVKNVKVRQCSEQSKRKQRNIEPCDVYKGVDLRLAFKA